MSVSASILDAMVKAGATAEMIVAVVRAAEQEDAAKLAEKRAKDAERKRRSRAKGAGASEMSRGHDVTSCDGRGHGVTDADTMDPLPKEKRKVSPCTPSKEKTQPLPNPPENSDEFSATPLTAAPKSDPRGSRLPEGWEPSPDALAWAAREAPQISVTTETERFRDFWQAKAGQDGRKLDWTATWRNWIRKAAEYQPRGSPGHPQKPVQPLISAKIYAERAASEGR